MRLRNACAGSMIAMVVLAGCGRASPGREQAANGPLATRNMPPLAGQRETCAGTRDKTFNLEVVETTGVDLGMGTTFAAWTYNGRLPGPTLAACEGDTVTLRVHNTGTVSHGLDSHALMIDARHYGPVGPGKTLTITQTVLTAGVFMYHCSAGPVTDLHIKSGLHGAMIVYPRHTPLRPAREIVIVEDAVYGTRGADGRIAGTDPARTQRNDQVLSMFNGRLDNDPVRVNPGDLIRIYFVNVGPGTAAAHVVGSIFDRASDGSTFVSHVQTFGVPAGGGATLEFYIPNAGLFSFVDHDKLAYLPWGMAVVFATPGVPGTGH